MRQTVERSSVVEFRPRCVGRADFCVCGDGSFMNLWQAWTILEVEEALGLPDFFAPMLLSAVSAGDRIELFQVAVADIGVPERDPIAMAAVIVTNIEETIEGRHLHFVRLGEKLHFNGAAGAGVSTGSWGGQFRVYRDGRRLGAFNTRVEADDLAALVKRVAS